MSKALIIRGKFWTLVRIEMRKRITYIIVLLFITSGCKNETSKVSISNYTDEELSKLILGTWSSGSCYTSDKWKDLTGDKNYEEPMTEEVWEWGRSCYAPNTLVITEDSIFEIDYPCVKYNSNSYSVKDGMIKIGYRAVILLPPDSTLELVSYHSIDQYHKMNKDIDSNLIIRLLNESVNPECLQGRWSLLTFDSASCYGDGYCDFNYPYNIEQELDLTKIDQVLDRLNNGSLKVKVNNDSVPFKVSFKRRWACETEFNRNYFQLSTELELDSNYYDKPHYIRIE